MGERKPPDKMSERELVVAIHVLYLLLRRSHAVDPHALQAAAHQQDCQRYEALCHELKQRTRAKGASSPL